MRDRKGGTHVIMQFQKIIIMQITLFPHENKFSWVNLKFDFFFFFFNSLTDAIEQF